MKDPKDYMQQQIDQLLNQNAQLQCRLSKAQDAYAAAENKAQTLQARNNLLELARCSSGKAYEEIIQVYEKQGAACQRQVEEAIALDSQSQAEIESLRELTDRMRKALNKSEIQLIALKKQQQQRRDGSSANDNVAIGSVQQGDPVCTLTAPSESNYSLAKFILAYEDEGKEWFNVFSELFNLREAHVNVLTQKENLHAVYQKLLDDMKHIQRNLSQRENDMATLQAELAKTKKENETLQVENNGSKNKVEEQNKTIARKQQQIEELHGALNATSYQLRETLRHTELEKKLLPLDIQKTADLLERATLVTDVDHDLLAFQSVDELQQRNAELVQEVRGLNHTLKAKASEIAALKRQHKAETKMLTNKLQEACTHICQSQLTIDTLKERLSEGYATLLPERLPKDIPMHRVKFGAELEALEKELDDARAAANASAIKAQNLHEELDLCKDQYKLLEQTSESRLQELKKLHIANGDLQIELNDSKNALQLCKNDLAILQTEKLALTEENNKLQVQVTASEQLYQESMTIKNAREAHIDQMAALIRERTSKMDINNKSSLEVIDYHKQLAKSQQVEIDSLDAELRTAKADLEELNHSNEIYAQRLEALQTENSRLKEENARVLYEEASLKEAKAILELKVLKYEEELTPERLTHNQKVADDLAAAQVELEALQSQAIEYNKKLQENEDTINKINQDRHKFALNVEAKFKELQGALESYREREKTMETAAKEIEKIRNEKVQVELGWQNEKTAHAAELQALQEKHDAQEIKNQALLQEIESYVSLARESKEQLARLRHELDEREANDQTENLKQEIEQLKKDLSEAQGDLATTKTQLETVQTQFEARESEWDTEFSSLRAELQAKQEEIAKLSERLINVASLSLDQHEELSFDAPEDELRKLAASLQHKYNEIKALNDGLTRDRDTLEQQLEKANEKAAYLENTIDQMNGDTSDVQKRMKDGLELVKTEAEAYKNSNAQLRMLLDELKNDYANHKKRWDEAASEKEENAKLIEEVKEKQAEYDKKNQELVQKLQDVTAELAKQTEELTQANIRSKRYQAIASSLKKRREEAEEKLNEQIAAFEEFKKTAAAAAAPDTTASVRSPTVTAQAATLSSDILKEKQEEIERLEAALKETSDKVAEYERSHLLYLKLKPKYNSLLDKAKQLRDEKIELAEQLSEVERKNQENMHAGQKRPVEDEAAVAAPPQKRRDSDTQ